MSQNIKIRLFSQAGNEVTWLGDFSFDPKWLWEQQYKLFDYMQTPGRAQPNLKCFSKSWFKVAQPRKVN